MTTRSFSARNVLAPLLCGAALAFTACTENTDGVVEGEEYGEPYDSAAEAAPADAPGTTTEDGMAGEYPELGADAVPEGEIGAEGAEPGQPVEDSDVNAGNRTTAGNRD